MRPSALRGGQRLTALEQAGPGTQILEPATQFSEGVSTGWASRNVRRLAVIDAAIRPADAPVTAAFYLPQFHAIPENDEWWGEGFTEWTNVGRAEAMFPGHRQPVRPAGPHGHYNLIDPAVVAWQTDLATRHDVDAFVYYHYWFDGHRLLDRPLDNYLQTEHSHPFAICWANENWTRRWDGKEREVLMAQNYGPNTPTDVFQSFLPYLSDPRYLRVGGKALLLVHRADHLPEPRWFADEWRALADAHGIGELWIVASETWAGVDPNVLGFDAVAEFPRWAIALSEWRYDDSRAASGAATGVASTRTPLSLSVTAADLRSTSLVTRPSFRAGTTRHGVAPRARSSLAVIPPSTTRGWPTRVRESALLEVVRVSSSSTLGMSGLRAHTSNPTPSTGTPTSRRRGGVPGRRTITHRQPRSCRAVPISGGWPQPRRRAPSRWSRAAAVSGVDRSHAPSVPAARRCNRVAVSRFYGREAR